MKENQTDERLVFCENILQLRKKNGLFRAAMAKRLGIGQKTLASLERGAIPPRLSCAFLFRIEREFGIPPKDMFRPAADTGGKKTI